MVHLVDHESKRYFPRTTKYFLLHDIVAKTSQTTVAYKPERHQDGRHRHTFEALALISATSSARSSQSSFSAPARPRRRQHTCSSRRRAAKPFFYTRRARGAVQMPKESANDTLGRSRGFHRNPAPLLRSMPSDSMSSALNCVRSPRTWSSYEQGNAPDACQCAGRFLREESSSKSVCHLHQEICGSALPLRHSSRPAAGSTSANRAGGSCCRRAGYRGTCARRRTRQSTGRCCRSGRAPAHHRNRAEPDAHAAPAGGVANCARSGARAGCTLRTARRRKGGRQRRLGPAPRGLTRASGQPSRRTRSLLVPPEYEHAVVI